MFLGFVEPLVGYMLDALDNWRLICMFKGKLDVGFWKEVDISDVFVLNDF